MQQPPPYQYPQQPAAAVVYPPQPGTNNVVVSQAPVQTTGFIVQNEVPTQGEVCCSGTSTKFNATSGMVTGIIQLIIAILSIVIGAGSYAFYESNFYYVGYAIWTGVLFFLPAGILGMISKNRSTSVVTAYLVISILAAIMSFSMICYEGIYAGVLVFVSYCRSTCFYIFFTSICNGYCNTDGQEGAVALHSILAILAFIELIVSIVASAMCCGGLRCCCASPTTTTTTTTTLYGQGANPSQSYLVQPAQPGQPGQAAQFENKLHSG